MHKNVRIDACQGIFAAYCPRRMDPLSPPNNRPTNLISTWRITFMRHSYAFSAIAISVGAVIGVAGGVAAPAAATTAVPSVASVAPDVAANVETLWGASAPAGAKVDTDTASVELGTAFTPTEAGQIVGVRFWKTPENTGTHIGNLWNKDGKRLATATFAAETSSGWQNTRFSKPIAVVAGDLYVASYLAPNGRYAATDDAPASSSDSLSVADGGSGVYAYGSASAYPAQTWRTSGYTTDVLFVPSAGATPAPPATSQPAPVPAPPATPQPAPVPAPPATPLPIPEASPETESSAFAGAGNTGPAAAGFNPTQAYTGPMTITQDRTVITNKVIRAGLRIEADNVTIQGNLIHGATNINADQAAIHVTGNGVKVLDNEIRGDSASDWTKTPVSGAKLLGDNFRFERNNVHRIGGDGVSLYGDNGQSIGNWVHDFVHRDGVHYDGLHYPVHVLTEPGLVKDNTVELWMTQGMTSAMSFPDTASKIVVDHNLIAGGNYGIMGGGAGITISNNFFWTRFSDRVGYYGPIAHLGIIGDVNWSNNSYTDDGETPRSPVEY
jgi:hypothetical protein